MLIDGLGDGLGDLLVFACGRDKKPLIKGWPENARRVEPPKRWPLVASLTGEPNGYDVLDIEREGLRWLETNRLPETRRHRTPRGWHYLFRHADGLSLSNDLRIHKDVHVRADGGYHVWWPREGLRVIGGPIADWPEWLLKLAMGEQQSHPSHHPSITHQRPGALGLDRDHAFGSLSRLDPTQFRDRGLWLRLMMSAKISGIDREEFIAWSISDPNYAGEADEIRRRWDHYEQRPAEAKKRVTEGTLTWLLNGPTEELPLPPVPVGRVKMSREEAGDINRIVAWAGRKTGDEDAFFWACCELGRLKMRFVVDDAGLERMLLDAAWKADLRREDRKWSRERVLRQIRNGLRQGSLGIGGELLEEVTSGHD
jgi:hypothetical protein